MNTPFSRSDWSDADYLARHLPLLDPTLEPIGRPQRLAGGLLNIVWRVPTRLGYRIIKVAPPFIASAPDIALDSRRSHFEADALALFSHGGALGRLADDRVRPPRLIRFVPQVPLLVLEDLGDLPDLQKAAGQEVPLDEHGAHLGRFIGDLHAVSSGLPELGVRFRNTEIQTTRRSIQYAGVAQALVKRFGESIEPLGSALADLGDRLLGPGRCLTMGDLWPASILIGGPTLRLIDWEFVHFGQPLQDAAHLLAHTWMLRHRSPSPAVTRGLETFERAFLDAYREALGERVSFLWDAPARQDAGLHFAAEILVRTIGAFSNTGPYAGDTDGPAVGEAVAFAIEMAKGGEEQSPFVGLAKAAEPFSSQAPE